MSEKNEKKLSVDELKKALRTMADELEKDPEALKGIDLKIGDKKAKIKSTRPVAYYPSRN